MNTLTHCFLTLIGALLASNVYATTVPGQACEGLYPDGKSLSYIELGAYNPTDNPIWISCPIVRLKDGGTAAVSAVVNFYNDGKTKTCYLEQFSPAGTTLKWNVASGITRLDIQAINPTLPWHPFVISCVLPAKSRITSYFFAEF